MPVFREPTGTFARLIAQENRREAEAALVESTEPAAAPAPESTSEPATPVLRNSERDPKWYARLHQLEERCEEIWPGRGLWQIQMGSNLWPRLANASAKTPDEIWEHALDRLAETPAIPRAICTYLAAMLERFVVDPPRHVKQRIADESIPTLVPLPDRPWVVEAEATLAAKVKRALATVARPARNPESDEAGRLQGLPEAQALARADAQGEAGVDLPPGVHGLR